MRVVTVEWARGGSAQHVRSGSGIEHLPSPAYTLFDVRIENVVPAGLGRQRGSPDAPPTTHVRCVRSLEVAVNEPVIRCGTIAFGASSV